METWLEEKEWKTLRGRLPKEFEWGIQVAKRKNKRERAMGAMMLGVKKRLRAESKGMCEIEEEVISRVIEAREERWRIVGIYVNEDIKKKMEKLKEWLEVRGEEVMTLIGGILMQERRRRVVGWKMEERRRRRVGRGNQRMEG